MYIKESLKNKFDIIYTPNNYKLFYISHHKLIRIPNYQYRRKEQQFIL